MANLHIFYAVPSSPNHWGLQNSQVWWRNFYDTLRDMGHDIAAFDFDFTEYNKNLDLRVPEKRAYVAAHQQRLEERLLEQVKAAHSHRPIDLFFSYFCSAHCRPEVIAEIRSMGILTVNFFCNASYQFYLVQDLAPAYEWSLVVEKFRLDDYRAAGANPYYFQEAANPKFYRPYPGPHRYDVAFIGQMYGDRPLFIHHLYHNQIPIRVWGPNWQASFPSGWQLWRGRFKRLVQGQWPRRTWNPQHSDGEAKPSNASGWHYPRLPGRILGSPLSDVEMIRRYSESKISLGFSKCGQTFREADPIRQVRLRDFEATMSGAFYLMEYTSEIEACFEIGKEIVCFDGADDLLDQVRYYLKHDNERERIRQAGYQRARRDHTWAQRFEQFFQYVGLHT